MLGVGFWFARRQTSTEEYFLAGRRMPWLVVALSMFRLAHQCRHLHGCAGHRLHREHLFCPGRHRQSHSGAVCRLSLLSLLSETQSHDQLRVHRSALRRFGALCRLGFVFAGPGGLAGDRNLRAGLDPIGGDRDQSHLGYPVDGNPGDYLHGYGWADRCPLGPMSSNSSSSWVVPSGWRWN